MACNKAVCAGVQKTPDRKVVGSPGVQGSPKKVGASAANSEPRAQCSAVQSAYILL
jgi:hypothetical protein